MSPTRRAYPRTLLVAAGLACAAAALSAELAAQPPAEPPPAGDDAGVEVLYPPDKAVLPSGDFDVICRAEKARLHVDGESYPWEPFEPPVRVAHVSLYCGPNTLEIGRKRIEVFVAETAARPGGPDDWPIWHKHPISGSGEERCGKCHEMETLGDGVAVGRFAGYKACFECHKAVEFEAIHAHPLEPIEACQMCHALHAAREEVLLKAPAKKLCAECHES